MAIALKILGFAGMRPAVDSRLSDDNVADSSVNTYLYSGLLRGMVTPTHIRDLTSSTATFVYRIPNNQRDIEHVQDSLWLEFENLNTVALKPALVDDQFSRYYWSSPGQAPMYNSLARIQAGTNALKLGVPRPAAPTVTSSGGSTTVQARSYTYTWVTEFGEEGPPASPANIDTGFTDSTYTVSLTLPASTDTDGTDRLIANTNIYRSVTGADGTTTFFFVAQIPVASSSYTDTADDATIVLNSELQSTNWTAPPDDLEGWVSMPNGMIAGWRGSEVWFSEPYRPHAWPSTYTQATDYKVIGLGVSGQMLAICTEANPYWGQGINPPAFTMSMIQTGEPCLSRGGILSAPEGVYYPSPNGLVLVQPGSVLNVSLTYLDKDSWKNVVRLDTLRAARLGTAYYSWGAATTGIWDDDAFDQDAFEQNDLGGARQGVLLDPIRANVLVSQLSSDTPTFNVFNDPWTGEVFLIRDGALYWLDVANLSPTREEYVWASKPFQTPNRRNLGAMKIYFDVDDTLPALNPTPIIYDEATYDAQDTLNDDQWGVVALYADDVFAWARELRKSGELMRLPSGFEPIYYKIVVVARVNISSLHAAETVRDLAKI